VLGLCLHLIDECRLFFVGILGERYGWVPTRYPIDALDRYGWIRCVNLGALCKLS